MADATPQAGQTQVTDPPAGQQDDGALDPKFQELLSKKNQENASLRKRMKEFEARAATLDGMLQGIRQAFEVDTDDDLQEAIRTVAEARKKQPQGGQEDQRLKSLERQLQKMQKDTEVAIPSHIVRQSDKTTEPQSGPDRGRAWYAPGIIGGMDESTLAKLSAVVGTQRKAVVEADGIPTRVYPGMEVEAYRGKTSTVAAVYTDFLGNEAYITEFHLNEHLSKRKQYAATASGILSQLLMFPEILVIDKVKDAVFYGQWLDEEERYFFAVVGKDSRMVYTVEVKPGLYKNLSRYDIIQLR